MVGPCVERDAATANGSMSAAVTVDAPACIAAMAHSPDPDARSNTRRPRTASGDPAGTDRWRGRRPTRRPSTAAPSRVVGLDLHGVPQRSASSARWRRIVSSPGTGRRAVWWRTKARAKDLQPIGPERMTHASRAAGIVAGCRLDDVDPQPDRPGDDDRTPGGRCPVSRSDGQSKSLPHRSDAQTSTWDGHGSARVGGRRERGPGDGRAASSRDVVADHPRRPVPSGRATVAGGGRRQSAWRSRSVAVAGVVAATATPGLASSSVTAPMTATRRDGDDDRPSRPGSVGCGAG